MGVGPWSACDIMLIRSDNLWKGGYGADTCTPAGTFSACGATPSRRNISGVSVYTSIRVLLIISRLLYIKHPSAIGEGKANRGRLSRSWG